MHLCSRKPLFQDCSHGEIRHFFQLDGKQAGQLTDEDDNKMPQTIKDGAWIGRKEKENENIWLLNTKFGCKSLQIKDNLL